MTVPNHPSKWINGHDPSSSLLCIYDRGGQPVAFFKGYIMTRNLLLFSLSLLRTRLSLQVFHQLETYCTYEGLMGSCEGIA